MLPTVSSDMLRGSRGGVLLGVVCMESRMYGLQLMPTLTNVLGIFKRACGRITQNVGGLIDLGNEHVLYNWTVLKIKYRIVQ